VKKHYGFKNALLFYEVKQTRIHLSSHTTSQTGDLPSDTEINHNYLIVGGQWKPTGNLDGQQTNQQISPLQWFCAELM
jgi:hypothetical protein